VQQQLDPAHEDLKREKFLEAWEYLLDEDEKWTGIIRWSPGEKWFSDQEKRKARKEWIGRTQNFVPLLPGPILGKETDVSFSIEPVEEVDKAVHSYAAQIAEFYAQQGQEKVSRMKIEKDEHVLHQMEKEGFSHRDIELGLVWLLQNRQKFGGEVHSLHLLPNVIGQVLKQRTAAPKYRESSVVTGEATLSTVDNSTENETLEKTFQSLSSEEGNQLREEAISNLLAEGHKEEFLRELKTLVKEEMFRLLRKRGEAQK
jgi:hypothetical protein